MRLLGADGQEGGVPAVLAAGEVLPGVRRDQRAEDDLVQLAVVSVREELLPLVGVLVGTAGQHR